MLASLIKKIPSHQLKKMLLRLGYFRNGKRLNDYQEVNGYYIYNVNNWHVPSDSLGWYVGLDTIQNECERICLYSYKPKPGDIVMDIGAGIGEETLYISTLVGPRGKVFSIEANPAVYQILTRVVELNKLSNVVPFNIALSETRGVIELTDEHKNFLSGTIHKSGSNREISYQVAGIPLVEFLKEHGIENVDYLKCNIEGAERYLLGSLQDGMPTVLNLAIACHDFRWKKEGVEFFRTKDLIIDFLKAHDYQIFTQNSGFDHIDDWVYASRT